MDKQQEPIVVCILLCCDLFQTFESVCNPILSKPKPKPKEEPPKDDKKEAEAKKEGGDAGESEKKPEQAMDTENGGGSSVDPKVDMELD